MLNISIIVCTFNRAESLAKTLDSIAVAARNVPDTTVEAVVVDNNSTDNTQIIIKQWAESIPFPVKAVIETRQGTSNARNAGMRAAAGEILAFIDDDCRLDVYYLSELVAYDAKDSELVLRGGGVALGDPADLPLTIKTRPDRVRWSRKLNSARHENLGDTLFGCNMTMRKAVADLLGPFDVRLGPGTRITAGEDIDYVYRAYLAGVIIEYVPDMRVYHFHGRKLLSDGKKLFKNYSLGGGALFAKYAFRSPALCRPLYWDIKNLFKELKAGTILFEPTLGFSYKDKLKWYGVGAIRFLLSNTRSFIQC